MIIEILSVEYDKTIHFPSVNVIGYSSVFRSSIISGSAWLVPYSGAEINLKKWESISVEMNYESISNFQVLSELKSTEVKLISHKDYKVIGVVIFTTDELFIVEVDDFSVTITFDETEGKRPSGGEIGEFNLHGLSLWDENI